MELRGKKMNIKSVLKLFIPPVFISLGKNLLKKRTGSKRPYISTINQIEKKSDSICILGNGPSLKETFNKYLDVLKTKECIVVNFFCKTDYYNIIKPKFYLLADPAFFGDTETYSDDLKQRIISFWDVFLSKTDWDINLIVPDYAKNTNFGQKCSTNTFVHLFYYNTSDNSKNTDQSKFELWDKNLIDVPAQTCLNTCLYIGIFLRYKEIYLVGADTNWVELLHVDQKTNEVYTMDSHFYGTVRRTLYADTESKIPQKLHDELFCIGNSLEAYWELNSYSEYAGVKVYNASEYSLIDAFERRNLC